VRGVRRGDEGGCPVLRGVRHHRVTLQVVLGLGFGDEGKGTIVDWLARRAASPPLVIRYNGGPQAAHHVVTDDGRTHCFAQLGSASFVDGARTHLGAEMAVDLYALHREASEFGGDVLARTTIDPRCVLVTPWHAILGRVREALRGAHRHGSTGRGVAEAKLGAHLVAGELGRGFADRLAALRATLRATAEALIDARGTAPDARDAHPGGATSDARNTPRGEPVAHAQAASADALAEARALLARGDDRDLRDAFLDAAQRPVAITATPAPADHVILESAQGALLDRDHGFFPHVTPSRITRAAAERAAHALGLAGPLEVWGVLRAYHTRHGEGPFPSEDAALTQSLPEHHNREDGPAGRFRVGWFDAVLARHALGFAGPIDHLAVTCVDRLAALPHLAIVDAWLDAPEVTTAAAHAAVPVIRHVDALPAAIEAALGRPIDVQSWGPTARAKRLRDPG
jgi:adenylosuccinate synthase